MPVDQRRSWAFACQPSRLLAGKVEGTFRLWDMRNFRCVWPQVLTGGALVENTGKSTSQRTREDYVTMRLRFRCREMTELEGTKQPF